MSGHIGQPQICTKCAIRPYKVILIFGIVQSLFPDKGLTIFTLGAPKKFLILTGSMQVLDQNGRIDFLD